MSPEPAQQKMRRNMRAAVGLPMAAVAGWASLWAGGMHAWQRIVEMQVDILLSQATFLRRRNHIARGADWTDHYGRRTRDVNVERV